MKFYVDSAPLSFRFQEVLPDGGKGVEGKLIPRRGRGEGYTVLI